MFERRRVFALADAVTTVAAEVAGATFELMAQLQYVVYQRELDRCLRYYVS
jgi:hypothetical protein